MVNRLADMHEIAPQLTEAVAKRISTSDLHDKALRDLGAFVHPTFVEDEHTYAVRIDDGAMLDAAEQIDHAREHLDANGQHQIASILGCTPERIDVELDTLTSRANARALKIRISGEMRDRARNGRYAYVHDRGQRLRRRDLGRRPHVHARPDVDGAAGRGADSSAARLESIRAEHPVVGAVVTVQVQPKRLMPSHRGARSVA